MTSKFEALNKRERWMVFGALLMVAYAVINMLLLSPVLARQKILSSELSADQAQLQGLQQQLKAYTQQSVIDPDAANKQRIATLQSHLKVLESKLNGLQTTLISPEKMPELLHSLLKKNAKLKLIELKTLPSQGLLESSTDDKNASAAASSAQTTTLSPVNKIKTEDSPAFKHGVELTVEGRYLDLLEYVSELEKMPWHVLWSKAALNAEHYPNCQLTLTVYTLSLDKTWLSI